jgi:hypothetical protein
MFSYSDQVLDAADDNGLLTVELAMQVMHDHMTSLYQMEQQGYRGGCCNAQELLWFLGY